MSEFILLEQFNRIIKAWWLIVVAAILGGAAGYVFHRSHPPVYEATATFFVSIDASQTQELPKDLYQYDEDIALAVTQAVILSPSVLENVTLAAHEQGIQVDPNGLFNNSAVERKHAFWELRYRDPDPSRAQTIANLWAEIAYQQMVAWKESGQIVNYVIFNPPIPAVTPEQPVLYGRNQLMLAGCLSGLVAGILLAEVWVRVGMHFSSKASAGLPAPAARRRAED
ncbi:MAG: hypothetical protein EHM70_17220 [Chloroflexota bacterium]|nr:MAG: hypothetical protein EHM70_17220 [Chloroflexota bacterium]